jgi:predicted Zn-dependent peptidase
MNSTSTLHSIAALAAALALGCGPGASQKKDEGTLPDGTTEVDGSGAGETSGALVFPEEPFRASQPGAGEPRDFSLPPVKSFPLGNQITVYLVERHELPTISVDLNFEGGSINDPRNKVGLASVCMDLVSEGTAKLDKLAFNAALADIASRVGSYASEETQGVTMSTLTKNFDETFALFRDTVRSPGFRKSDLDRMIDRRLEALKQQKADPSGISRRLADSILYGESHPFGKIITEKTYKAVNVNDCKRYHRSYIKPKGARLYVVGDMTEAQVMEKFSPLLAGWKGAPKRSVKLGKPRTRAGKVFFVHVPGAAQSVIRAVHFGPRRIADDYFANSLMSAVLGGSFSSRVNMNLREGKGYTYGARASLGYTRNYGALIAASSVRADSTYQSVLEFSSEMKALASGERPATREELARERDGDILSLPGLFATASASLSRYRGLVYFGLPLDYYNSYVESLTNVTLEQVNASAQKHLKPGAAVWLVVGDGDATQIQRDGEKDVPLVDAGGNPVTLRTSLERLVAENTLGQGKLVTLDADGKPAK